MGTLGLAAEASGGSIFQKSKRKAHEAAPDCAKVFAFNLLFFQILPPEASPLANRTGWASRAWRLCDVAHGV